MDKLLYCVQAFEKMLDVEYRIIIGRKGKAAELCIGFSKLDFHHLMGLGKLKDLRIATRNREAVFNEILNGQITYETIVQSRYIHLIENRFQPLLYIEQLFDDNRLILQALYTMLYKEKTYLSTGVKQTQYDKLSPKT